MFKHIFCAAAIFAATLTNLSSAAQLPQQDAITVSTDIGDVQLPTAKELNDAGEALKNDSTIKDDERKDRQAEIANAQNGLLTLRSVQGDISSLKKTVTGASQQLRKLSSELYKAEQQYSDIPSVKKYTSDNIGQLR